MLASPDGDESDIVELFNAVSLSGSAELTKETGQEQSGERKEQAEVATRSDKRPILSIVRPDRAQQVIRIFRADKGQARPLEDVTRLFEGKRVKFVKISDPFALADGLARAAQVTFLHSLSNHCSGIEAVTFEYDPEAGRDLERDQTRDVREKIASAFERTNIPRLVFSPKRRDRRSSDDFHDREVLVNCLAPSGSVETHTIWIGRGLLSLASRNFGLKLTYQGPGSA
jgi:hypothetical protein